VQLLPGSLHALQGIGQQVVTPVPVSQVDNILLVGLMNRALIVFPAGDFRFGGGSSMRTPCTVLLMGLLFVVHMPTVLAMASAHMATVSHPCTKEHQTRALLKPVDS
jgi:hypothetical protein